MSFEIDGENVRTGGADGGERIADFLPRLAELASRDSGEFIEALDTGRAAAFEQFCAVAARRSVVKA